MRRTARKALFATIVSTSNTLKDAVFITNLRKLTSTMLVAAFGSSGTPRPDWVPGLTLAEGQRVRTRTPDDEGLKAACGARTAFACHGGPPARRYGHGSTAVRPYHRVGPPPTTVSRASMVQPLVATACCEPTELANSASNAPVCALRINHPLSKTESTALISSSPLEGLVELIFTSAPVATVGRVARSMRRDASLGTRHAEGYFGVASLGLVALGTAQRKGRFGRDPEMCQLADVTILFGF